MWNKIFQLLDGPTISPGTKYCENYQPDIKFKIQNVYASEFLFHVFKC